MIISFDIITSKKSTILFNFAAISRRNSFRHHDFHPNSDTNYIYFLEGQLGYPSVDTQPTPRRVSSLRPRIIAVAAANKHSAAVSESGEVFTWGCNKEGQLGYGTSNSASNYTPRVVECLKGRNFKAISAAKYHTVVLGTDGEVR